MTTESKSQRGAATREQIVDAAARLIHLRGYHCTSVDDVLRETGVGKGNFYYYFKSKGDLGHAIIDRVTRGFLDRTVRPAFADPAGDPVAQTREFLDRVVAIHRERNCAGGCPLGNLASEMSEVHEGFRQRLADIFALWRQALAHALARGRAAGVLSQQCEPEALAEFVVATLEGAILLAKVGRDIGPLERCAAELGRHLDLYAADAPAARAASWAAP
jgi:TetR/AcrR family transcriptional repressor of nem operon